MKSHPHLALVAGALMVVAVACKEGTPEPASPAAPAPAPASVTGPSVPAQSSLTQWSDPTASPLLDNSSDQGMSSQGAVNAPTTTTGATLDVFSDPQIAAVESAANAGGIQMARLASTNGQSKQVKDYATKVINERADAEATAQKIVADAKITPVDNDVSMKLKADARAKVATLKEQKGKAFDKAYIDAQIDVQREVLSTIDEKLMPNARDPKLKSHLGDVRRHVATDLAKAKEIGQKLGTPKP